MADSVTSREDEAKQFDTDMQTKSEQIHKLTEEINALQAKKTAIINEISSNRAKIDQVRNNFAATMKVFVDRINSDIEKIKKYLLKIS
jgi:predicted  nucleic acid-binding Zn-ribbon protein